MNPIKHSIKTFGSIFFHAAMRLIKEGYTYRAAALAYTTLLSLVPALAIMVSAMSHSPLIDFFLHRAKDYMLANFLPSSNITTEKYLQSFVAQSQTLPALSLVFFGITIILLVQTIDEAIYSVGQLTLSHTLDKDTTQKRHIKSHKLAFMFRWFILLCFPFIIGITLLLSNYLFIYFDSIPLLHTYLTSPTLLPTISISVNIVALTILYKTVLSFKVKLMPCLMGSVVAAILFEIGKAGFGLYIFYFSNYAQIYGALASVPVFLIWMYVSWIIVLFGAVFVHESIAKI
ncbi:MAG: YihY family inner membrane protein [Gammaproteobacteria bacterium]